MSAEVPKNFAAKFKDDWIMLVQQRGPKLRGTVRENPDMLEGKLGYFDRIGSVASKKKTTRHGDTPIINTPHSRRRIIRDVFQIADMIDRSDVRRMMKNPQNRYVTNFRWAFGRDFDDAVISAANGTAFSIDEDDTAASVALPAAQKVAAAATGLTKPKILDTYQKFVEADVDVENEKLYWAAGPQQWTDLLGITEVISADFVSAKALENPREIKFMGFHWIPSTRLLTDGSGDRLNLAWAETGIGVAADMDPFVDVGPRRDKQSNTQIYMEWEIGATRVEDEKVVEIACVEP